MTRAGFCRVSVVALGFSSSSAALSFCSPEEEAAAAQTKASSRTAGLAGNADQRCLHNYSGFCIYLILRSEKINVVEVQVD